MCPNDFRLTRRPLPKSVMVEKRQDEAARKASKSPGSVQVSLHPGCTRPKHAQIFCNEKRRTPLSGPNAQHRGSHPSLLVVRLISPPIGSSFSDHNRAFVLNCGRPDKDAKGGDGEHQGGQRHQHGRPRCKERRVPKTATRVAWATGIGGIVGDHLLLRKAGGMMVVLINEHN